MYNSWHEEHPNDFWTLGSFVHLHVHGREVVARCRFMSHNQAPT